METPVLSKKQQKKALSSRKKPKETIKNLLANPYNNYFPLVTDEDAESIGRLLKKLPKFKPEKKNAPWSVIKEVPREERKRARENYTERIEIDEEIKKDLIFGINNVTACLEKSEASSVLITADVNPQFMVKHVIDLSVLRNVPVLVLPELRQTLQKVTGIKSTTIAVKKSAKHPLLNLISDKVGTVREGYPVPKKHVHYENSAAESRITLDENLLRDLDLEKDEEVAVEDFLLRRTDAGSRVFVPDSSKPSEGASATKLEPDESGFIKFSDAPVEYKPLQIKRVRNNKDRKKRFKSS